MQDINEIERKSKRVLANTKAKKELEMLDSWAYDAFVNSKGGAKLYDYWMEQLMSPKARDQSPNLSYLVAHEDFIRGIYHMIKRHKQRGNT